MTFSNAVFLVVVICGVIQCIVIIGVTRRNQAIFDKHRGTAYGLAIKELSTKNPEAAFVIRACYAAYFVELALLALLK